VGRLLVLVFAAALIAPPVAAAETIKLGWREDDGVGVMRFGVSTLSLGNGRWSVHASFTNRSPVVLRIERRFALLVYHSKNTYFGFRPMRATRFAPDMPMTVPPGRTWRGSFGGVGKPPRGTYLRVRFGRFNGRPSPLPDFPNGFSWITAHSHHVR
jgi:hypothetical protein